MGPRLVAAALALGALALLMCGCGDKDAPSGDNSMADTMKQAQKDTAGEKAEAPRRQTRIDGK